MLVIGQGGREHALAWKLKQSRKVTKVFVAPGNAGTAADAVNVPVAEDDVLELTRLCRKEAIELAVVGPEGPLAAGVADALRVAGVPTFGPGKAGAELEASKVYCKHFLRRGNIPTADFRVFLDMKSVLTYLEAKPGPCVVKADGLCAGKGAIVCDDADQAREAAERMLLRKEFGAAGKQILIEERLVGPEVSVLAITDGKTIVTLPSCQDHKRALDGDQGLNTGGMGAYSPAPLLTPALAAEVERSILIPTLARLERDKTPFIGVLYAGVMLTATG
ncbi:MAG: phosphoribosylamine--glycine ligase, partial [Planctomycetia bacterium]